MILYLLPLLDILTATVLILHTHFNLFPVPVVIAHGTYLGFKGAVFARTDFASKLDLLCSLYIFLVAFGIFVNTAVTSAAFIWLVQKAVFALLPLR